MNMTFTTDMLIAISIPIALMVATVAALIAAKADMLPGETDEKYSKRKDKEFVMNDPNLKRLEKIASQIEENNKALEDICRDFVSSQVEMPDDIKEVLYSNLWDLYED